MKKRIRRSATDDIVLLPAYPNPGTQLFRRLRNALTEAFGFEPSFPRLGSIMGVERSTANYWFQVFDHPHVVAFLCLLERLPERKRQELLHEFCRELPTLNHPRLAHDPFAVTNLENLLRQGSGITLIRGGTEFHRTFVITALGQTFQRSEGKQATIAGLDMHEPRKWVPIETITYFKEPLRTSRIRQLIGEAWPKIASSKATLVLLNGIWSAMPELRVEILNMASTHHVVIADAKTPEPNDLAARFDTPVHAVTVGPDRGQGSWIRAEVEAI